MRTGRVIQRLFGLAIIVGLAVCLHGLPGCASKNRKADDEIERPLIADIVFEGVTRFSRDELLSYLYMDETSGLAAIGLSAKHYYSPGLAAEDRQRIDKLYDSFGYYDAHVTDIKVEPIKKDGSRVRVIVVIDEGKPARISELVFKWSEQEVARNEVEKSCGLSVGSIFSVQALNNARDAMLTELQQRGYAFAQVTESALVDRDAAAVTVSFEIRPGPACVVGTIRYEGLTTIPADELEPEVDFAPGKPYSPALLKRIENAVYGLDAFRTVTVTPEPKLNADGKLDLTVRVQESQHQSLKVGFGFGIESNRWDLHLITHYRHRSIDARLMDFELNARAGYAVLPYPWNIQEHGPLLKIDPWFKKKGWLEDHLVWALQPSFELGIEEGYQFYSPSLRLGVSRWLFGFTHAEISYNAEFYDFFSQSGAFGQNKTILGRDYQDPYFLSFLEFGYTLYFTDSLLDPQNGVVIGATYEISGTWIGSYYDYMKISPQLRAYWTVWSHLQIALRGETGLLYTYGYKPGAPIAQKYYLGGSDTVRGWGLKRLSPRIDDCDENGDCSSLPIGGRTLFLANLELRFMLIKELYFVPFADMGDVEPDETDYQPGQWQYSTGGGLRYNSPIGKFRLDFGYRLNGYTRFPDDRRWAIHLSFGETF
jgi:outer membrane protein assembly factor BamA